MKAILFAFCAFVFSLGFVSCDDGFESCFDSEDCRFAWFMAFVYPNLPKNDCPPPLVTLQPGLQTLNTGGSDVGKPFTFSQSETTKQYQIRIFESVGQNVRVFGYDCRNFQTQDGNPNVSQTETYIFNGNVGTYYNIVLLGAVPSYEVQIEIPSTSL